MPNTVASEKEGSDYAAQSQPINDTPFRRYLTLLAIRLLKRFRKRHGPVLLLSDKICVKYGSHVSLREASTMQFIAKHTSIPVPRVYCAFTNQNRGYIVMERIHGEPVGAGWFKRSEESRAKILDQLKEMIEKMRRITSPEDIGVANVDGGPLFDVRLPGTSNHFGPFRTIQDFHRYLRGGQEAHPDHKPEISELISQQDKLRTSLVFTHGDLSSLNILASGDEVVGIIDWETAGWFPSYWEYTTAWNVNPQNQFWRNEVDKFLQPMPEELDMEKIRLKYFGDF
ncbi:kinase-like protein [Dothidotthia symphoricarpi CBS 119687]|uniref:Kinase-like protein n=1 Tax=Dothidotthia symphoricarpi CBS 119687 TaxID=1392245 RepID=A0A6A6A107_9PLEO|nr:kinase-like protein [Dothidotthia symphoricarpi CBS 119687]KAF2124398.1 kinase-like protein [Dothidotthia symphoricarpi CBS 119687]